MSKVCVVTYVYRDFTIQWGEKGSINLMGVFDSLELAKDKISQWYKDNPDHWIAKDIKEYIASNKHYNKDVDPTDLFQLTIGYNRANQLLAQCKRVMNEEEE